MKINPMNKTKKGDKIEKNVIKPQDFTRLTQNKKNLVEICVICG
jgi:hypothetical protein